MIPLPTWTICHTPKKKHAFTLRLETYRSLWCLSPDPWTKEAVSFQNCLCQWNYLWLLLTYVIQIFILLIRCSIFHFGDFSWWKSQDVHANRNMFRIPPFSGPWKQKHETLEFGNLISSIHEKNFGLHCTPALPCPHSSARPCIKSLRHGQREIQRVQSFFGQSWKWSWMDFLQI